MVLQLQANSQNQLTAADVEVIVRRILGAELATLRTSMDTDKKEAYTAQVSYSFWNAREQVLKCKRAASHIWVFTF